MHHSFDKLLLPKYEENDSSACYYVRTSKIMENIDTKIYLLTRIDASSIHFPIELG